HGPKYPYVVMEWVEGFTLYDWFREQPRSSREVLQVLEQLASGLAAAHACGALHRDVKGDNIRVTAAGRAVLVDWGSGWFVGAHPLTDTTAPPGTTAYRPPEQRRFQWQFRKDLEARWHSTASDDLYSLGVTLYRMVTEVYLPPCTDGGEPVEREVLPPSAMATVCLELEMLILRLVSDDREQRGTAEQLAGEAAVLARSTGPQADRPILPTPSAVPTEEGVPAYGAPSSAEERVDESGPSTLSNEDLSDTAPARPLRSARKKRRRPASGPTLPAWLSLTSAGLVSGLVVALAMQPRTPHVLEPTPAPWLATPEEIAQFATDGGVADEALASVEHSLPRTEMDSIRSLGRPMPPKAYPGQKKPPCDPRTQRVILGACWIGPISDAKPPCGNEAFDGEDGCYVPLFTSPRTPTSAQP
ncbi:serine/threonine-protein kinase, partial [Hyalangium sp.]|uniref:serine/threonine-protein kinase n=1 Tax=Hyalangium sp. TaxID=2028555 RepID=UPI002D3A11A3